MLFNDYHEYVFLVCIISFCGLNEHKPKLRHLMLMTGIFISLFFLFKGYNTWSVVSPEAHEAVNSYLQSLLHKEHLKLFHILAAIAAVVLCYLLTIIHKSALQYGIFTVCLVIIASISITNPLAGEKFRNFYGVVTLQEDDEKSRGWPR